MKQSSLVTLLLVSILAMLAIPSHSAQDLRSAAPHLRDSPCDTPFLDAPGKLAATPAPADDTAGDDAERQDEVAAESLTGMNVRSYIGFYNVCSPATTVHIYHGENTRTQLDLYRVPLADFADILLSDWSWTPVNTFVPRSDQLIKRFYIDGSATDQFVPFAFYYRPGMPGPSGILKQTALELTDASGENLKPGVYFLQFSAPDFEHGYGSDQLNFRTKYFLNVSTAALTLKRSGGNLLVWAVDVNSGGALAGERIDIYGENAALLATGVTDEHGVLKLDSVAAGGEVLAVLNSDLHFALGYTGWKTAGRPHGQRFIWSPHNSRAHIFTDRQVYLPGQKVYFRGIVRAKDDMRYTLPDFETVSRRDSQPGLPNHSRAGIGIERLRQLSRRI